MRSILFLLLCFKLLFSQTYVYECQEIKPQADSKSRNSDTPSHFIITIDTDKVLLYRQSIPTELKGVPSASGEKYEGGGTMFWVQGYEAMLITPDYQYKNCMNNRYKAIWEDARLRGNDFRATGNEPGWYLELSQTNKKALLVSEYGKEKYELVLPRAYSTQHRGTLRYKIQGFLDILIENKSCIDSMTGHRFKQSVRLKLFDKTYRGCGRYL